VQSRAQNVQPTPTPTPVVTDRQNVPAEDLKGVPSIAPNYRSDDRSLPDLGRVGVDMTQQRSLTLKDALELALDNNKDIEITRKSIRSAEFDVQAALGVYEPRFSGQAYYERSKAPVFSLFGGGPNYSLTQSNLVGNAGLQGLIRDSGGSYNVSFNNTRNSTNNIFTSVNPTYTSNLSFNFTQPLFRGRRIDQARRTIEITKKNLSLTDIQFRQRAIETVAAVQRSYWDLAFALRNLQVQRDSLRDAKDQLEHNRRLVQEGQLAPIDIVAAETQVVNFEQSVYDALNTVNLAENLLKNLISTNRSDAIWAQALTPVDSVELTAPTTTLNEALEMALQNRPEIEINNTQKDLNALDQRFYRDQHRPQIDLIANYTTTGAAGTYNPNAYNPFASSYSTVALNQAIANLNRITTLNYPTLPQIVPVPVSSTQPLPNNLIGGYGSDIGNMFANRYPTFRIGVQFNLPLFGDKSTKAQLGKSLVEAEKIQTQREQIEQGIQVEVRNSLQAIRTAEARLRAAAIARENTAKQYDSEQRKLDSGQSDIYKVLERQTALTVARSNELRARTELNKAIADLQRSTGNSLKANDIAPKAIK
jgi:HAE1 family hydrophobic/amphiphilic exporter-1